jgi:hypothetical protein
LLDVPNFEYVKVPKLLITRARAAPSHETFKIPPIRELLNKYVGNGEGWVDPYAGNWSPAEFTNDHNPEKKASFHLEAEEFCAAIFAKPPGFAGILYDPPYSRRQVSEHYRMLGKKATALDTSDRFYNRVKNPICEKIRPGGYAICFGYHSNGFGEKRGFKLIEVLLVAHGSYHYDTICTVEIKVA